MKNARKEMHANGGIAPKNRKYSSNNARAKQLKLADRIFKLKKAIRFNTMGIMWIISRAKY